jgi:hypothetical protein
MTDGTVRSAYRRVGWEALNFYCSAIVLEVAADSSAIAAFVRCRDSIAHCACQRPAGTRTPLRLIARPAQRTLRLSSGSSRLYGWT